MLKIGSLQLDAQFYQAGLAGYSDTAMRLIARKHGAPYAVTEAMLDQFLINGGKGLAAAELHPDDHPIAGQLMGSHPEEIAKGCKILLKLGYDVIDINLACPVKKIRKKARGGHLLQAPDEAVDILDAVRQVVPDSVPLTVKLRRGTDDTPDSERNFFTIFEALLRLGYNGTTVHGRTVEQKYLGPSRWSFLKDLTARYKNEIDAGFTVMGSGDIWCAADIFRMIDQTGVTGVSVARGCIGNPWIFEQARGYQQGDHDALTRPPTIAQQKAVLLEHFDLSANLHGEFGASMMMRKFGIKFSRHHPLAEEVSKQFIMVKSVDDWRAVVERYYTAAYEGLPAAVQTPQPAGVMDCASDNEEESCGL